MATVEDVERLLAEHGYQVSGKKRMPDGRGFRLDLKTGGIVNVFDTGTVGVQGKVDPKLKEVLGGAKNSVAAPHPPDPRQVFVVYGHDMAARTALEAMLRRWKMEPLILDQLPSEGATIIEKLHRYQGEACFGVVLVTPDDEGHRASHPDERKFRARQNVVMELGMLLTQLGRARVAILMKSGVDMERPSDIQGLIYISFKDSIEECKTTLAKEMAAQGIRLDVATL